MCTPHGTARWISPSFRALRARELHAALVCGRMLRVGTLLMSDTSITERTGNFGSGQAAWVKLLIGFLSIILIFHW